MWLVEGGLTRAGSQAVEAARDADGVYVSTVTAWEIGLLARPRANRPPRVSFVPDPLIWFERLVDLPGMRLALLTPTAALRSSALPGDLHGDPGHRLMIAIARELNLPILTRDRAILAYAEAGHVRALAC